MKKSIVKVRFAPSPTGFLHIGGLRSALYDYLFARQNNGKLVLRIEDTDQKRKVKGVVESLVSTLSRFIEWDEGLKHSSAKGRTQNTKTPRKIATLTRGRRKHKNTSQIQLQEVGNYGPYIQSERHKKGIYKKHVDKLIEDKKAYYCFCSPERLKKLREKQSAQKLAPRYDRYCFNKYTPEEIEKKIKNKEDYTIRLKVPGGGKVEFEDIVRGKIIFDTALIDDQILIKSDGFPTYHLASVVDDYLMKITHVIRGEEWISSTPKHILLYKAFGWELPQFAHLPLLLNPDHSKLSKRQGDVAVEDYLKKGYLEEALINFVALLGWNPGKGSTQEIFSREELVKNFKLENVHLAGAVCDLKRLDWFNNHYIKQLNLDDLYKKSQEFFLAKDFVKKADESKQTEKYLKKVLTIEQERLHKLSEVGESNRFFFEEIKYDKKLLLWKKMKDESEIKPALEKAKEALENYDLNENNENWNIDKLQELLLKNAEDYDVNDRGKLLWPLRAALTGQERSPSPFEIIWVLGKEESLKRIDLAMGKL